MSKIIYTLRNTDGLVIFEALELEDVFDKFLQQSSPPRYAIEQSIKLGASLTKMKVTDSHIGAAIYQT